MTDFFISYNRVDRSWAEWIGWQLEDAGYMTMLQAWDFRPGFNFVLAMQHAASQAERTIAVLSPDYLTARFTQPEWAVAFGQDPTGAQGLLLPVRVRQCDLTGLLPQIIYINLVGLDEGTAKEVLLVGVRRGRTKPPVAPGFPGPQESAVPCTVPQVPSFPGRDAAEEEHWQMIKDKNEPAVFQHFIATYPQSHRLELARARLLELEAQTKRLLVPPVVIPKASWEPWRL